MKVTFIDLNSIDVLISWFEVQFDRRDSNGNYANEIHFSLNICVILSYLSKWETDISSLSFIIKFVEICELKSQIITKIKTNSSLFCMKVERM
jgi:hypothetical protein